MTIDNTTRRRLLTAGTTTVLAWTAGCLGDDESLNEIEEALDQTEVHLDEAEQFFDELEAHLDVEEWDSCRNTASEIPPILDTARQEANDALDIATEEGHTEHANVVELMIDVIDILEQMSTEVDHMCEAAAAEDYEEFEDRLDALDQLDQELSQTEQDLDQAIRDLEE